MLTALTPQTQLIAGSKAAIESGLEPIYVVVTSHSLNGRDWNLTTVTPIFRHTLKHKLLENKKLHTMPVDEQELQYLNKWARTHRSLLERKSIAYQHFNLNSSEIVWQTTNKSKTENILGKLVGLTQMTFKGNPEYIQGIKDIASTTSAMIEQLDTKFWLLRSENLKEKIEQHMELMDAWLEKRNDSDLKELIARKVASNKNAAQRMGKCLMDKYWEKSERAQTTTLVPKSLRFLDLAEPSGGLKMPVYSTFRTPGDEPHNNVNTSKYQNLHKKAGTLKRKAELTDIFEIQAKKQLLTDLSTDQHLTAVPKQMNSKPHNCAVQNPTAIIQPDTNTPKTPDKNVTTEYLVKSVEKLKQIAPYNPNPRNVRELLLEVASQKRKSLGKSLDHPIQTHTEHIRNELMNTSRNTDGYSGTSTQPSEARVSLTEALYIAGEEIPEREEENTAQNKGGKNTK